MHRCFILYVDSIWSVVSWTRLFDLLIIFESDLLWNALNLVLIWFLASPFLQGRVWSRAWCDGLFLAILRSYCWPNYFPLIFKFRVVRARTWQHIIRGAISWFQDEYWWVSNLVNSCWVICSGTRWLRTIKNWFSSGSECHTFLHFNTMGRNWMIGIFYVVRSRTWSNIFTSFSHYRVYDCLSEFGLDDSRIRWVRSGRRRHICPPISTVTFEANSFW